VDLEERRWKGERRRRMTHTLSILMTLIVVRSWCEDFLRRWRIE